MLGGAGRSGCCGIHGEDSARQTLAIEPVHGRLQIRRILKFHKAESTGVTSDAIAYYLCKGYGMALLLEPLT